MLDGSISTVETGNKFGYSYIIRFFGSNLFTAPCQYIVFALTGGGIFDCNCFVHLRKLHNAHIRKL